MSEWAWVAWFALLTAFTGWMLFLGGAEEVEGSFLAALLFDAWAPRWSDEGLKIFVGGVWFLAGVWFVYGLVYPNSRFY